MRSKEKNIYCPICGNTKKRKYWAMPGYRLARCAKCEMVWDYFPPDNLLPQYDKSYFNNDNSKGGYANYFEGMRINRKTFYERLNKIEKKLGRKGRLLDIGCALGDCLREAKKLGWVDARGLEVSKYAYNFAKKRGLDIKKGLLRENRFKKNYFDVVAYQDVLEHIKDPVDELRYVYKLLKPGGIVYIVTPDVGGFWKKILGPLWYHYKPIEHVSYFSKKTIRLTLKKAGYVDIEANNTTHVLSLGYILNRLRFYFPYIFEFILKITDFLKINNFSLRLYTGELEAWGRKS